MSALVETIPTPWAASPGPGVAWWLRSLVSLLAAVGILAVALPVALGASGGDAEADPLQVFSSGPLIAAEASGGGSLSIAGMAPGQSRSATIRVANTGSDAAVFSLAARIADRAAPGGAPLSGAMTLRIRTAGGAPLYAGSLGGLSRLALGRIPAGGARAYRFTVTLPSGVGNEVAGASSSAAFAWSAA